jgi:sugar phosphate isomerase/epimerase
MYTSLNAPAIGITGLALPALLTLARDTGFTGLDFDIREARALEAATSRAAVQDLFAAAGVRPGAWGLPVNGVQSDWATDPAELAACAALARALDAPRCATWVPSWNDDRDYAANFACHAAHLRPAAQVLHDHGCRLGLEFLGPKTLRDGKAHGFIHTMDQMLELAAAIGTGNVGLLLDAWHLFTSHGTLADLGRLTAADIVHVRINDAPPGLPFDLVQDTVRHLPLETGVLDLAGFLRGLAALTYDGPVVTEPFNARLNALAARDPAAAAREVASAMSRLWQMSGLA